jgi:hypothetical protein
MVPPAVSFDSFVKQNREKKKNEALAQQFLGGGNRGRKSNNGPGAKPRVESEKPSLLSRINGGAGVQKRSASAKPASSIEGKWQHDLHKLNNPRGGPRGGGVANGRNLPRTASASQIERNSRTYDKFAGVLNARGPAAGTRSNDAPGFSIRGVATGGPCTVIASNFAPGTTAADIEAVMVPVGGETLGCRLISASPTVMVELQFASKEGAENVVATFNNQKVSTHTPEKAGYTTVDTFARYQRGYDMTETDGVDRPMADYSTSTLRMYRQPCTPHCTPDRRPSPVSPSHSTTKTWTSTPMPAQEVASKTAATDSARVAAEAHREAPAAGTKAFATDTNLLHFFLYDTLSRMMARSNFGGGTRTCFPICKTDSDRWRVFNSVLVLAA